MHPFEPYRSEALSNRRLSLKTLSLSIGSPVGNHGNVRLTREKPPQVIRPTFDARNDNLISSGKSRVPDIQMINKYYGLVPKKFVFNRRTDLRAVKSQLNFGNVTKPNPEFKLNEYHFASRKFDQFLRNGRNLHDVNTGIGISNAKSRANFFMEEATKQSVQEPTKALSSHKELVARKMCVSNPHKWRLEKDKGRSQSLCDDYFDISHPVTCTNCSYGISDSCQQSEASTPEPDVQRVIKINLHSMKWEESFKVKEEQNLRKKHGLVSQGSPVTKDSRRPLQKAISVEERLVTTPCSPEVNLQKSPETSVLTKTFDGDRMFCKAQTRPATTSIISNKQRNKSSGPTQPQKAFMDAGEKRRAFGKSHSLGKETLVKGESEDESEIGEGCGTISRIIVAEKGSVECAKYLYVQSPPEICTMISTVLSEQEDQGQTVVAVNKSTNQINDESVMDIMKKTNGIQLLDESNQVRGEKKGESCESRDNEVCEPREERPALDSSSEALMKDDGSVERENRSLGSTMEPRHHNKHNIPLRKAASISCEQEITETDDISHKDGTDDFIRGGGGKVRCKTAKPRGNVSFAKTASMKFIPSRIRSHHLVPLDLNHIKVNVADESIQADSHGSSRRLTASAPLTPINGSSQSRASRNRKLLLKKALAELNQASASLNKKLSSQRPRTAPVPEQPKKSSVNASPEKINARLRHNEFKIGSGGGGSLGSAPVNSANNNQSSAQSQDTKQSQIRRQTITRQHSITFMENLFGSSLEERGSKGEFEKEGGDETSTQFSAVSAKKREECIKIYEKMKKTGCDVKLETIFRGMMTPSEYRNLMQVVEKKSEEKDI